MSGFSKATLELSGKKRAILEAVMQHHNRQGQIDQFLFAELLAHLLIQFVRDVIVRN